MKRLLLIHIILISIITISCKRKIQKEKNTEIISILIDSTLLRKKALSNYIIDTLPIGIKEIVNRKKHQLKLKNKEWK